MPVLLGTLLAWDEGIFHPFLFFLALTGGIFMQAATNLINTYGDFRAGVDTEESAKTCPQLVQNIFKPGQIKAAGITLFAVAGLIGLYLTWLQGWPVFLVGILGLVGGYGYTAGIAYKYKGLGSVLVFFLMGPMMVWGAYFVQTGLHSWQAVWISLPVGFLVSGILHANDWRDLEHDQNAGIKTLALYIGQNKSLKLYYGLNIAAYLSLAGLILIGALPLTALLPLILLPQFRQVLRNASEAGRGNLEKLGLLEAGAAQFHFRFGVLLAIGMLINLVL